MGGWECIFLKINIPVWESDVASDKTFKLYLSQKYPKAELYLEERC